MADCSVRLNSILPSCVRDAPSIYSNYIGAHVGDSMSLTFDSIRCNSIAKLLTMGVQFGITTVLARTLAANDYGVVAVAMIFIGFLGRFDDIGMTAAIVQRPRLDNNVIGTAQTINLALVGALFIASQIVAPFSAHLFHNDAVPMVVHVLGLGFLITSLSFLPSAILTRNMQFVALRGSAVGGTLVRGVVALCLALAGGRYWSLVAGGLAGSLTTAIVLRKLSPVHARWTLNRRAARDLLDFGLPLFGAGLLGFALFNLDNAIIGSSKGTIQLGYYTIAVTWATFVCSALSEVIHSVLLPRFSQLQGDRNHLAERYTRSLRATLFFALMANAALFAIADGFLFTVLGKGTTRWMPALIPLQILCLYGVSRAAMEPVGSVLMAMGQSKLLFRANLVAVVIEASLLPIVVRIWDLPGVAVLITIAYTCQWFVYGPFLKRELQITARKLVAIAAPGLSAAAVAITVARNISLGHSELWPTILLRSAVTCAVFAIVHEILSCGSILAEIAHVLGRAPRASAKPLST